MSNGSREVVATEKQSLRRLFGTYPTGVVFVSSVWQGEDCGMVVNSFTSVSLDPPLVAFCAADESSTWPKIRSTGSCLVSVLDEDQGELCRNFVDRHPDRFELSLWDRSSQGYLAPRGRLSMLECDIFSVMRAGDHEVALLYVSHGHFGESSDPLLFSRGSFSKLSKS